jgi:hypothetical protein
MLFVGHDIKNHLNTLTKYIMQIATELIILGQLDVSKRVNILCCIVFETLMGLLSYESGFKSY